MRLLFLYSGRGGQAKKITQYMAACLPARVNYEIYNIRHFSGAQLSQFDAVIIDMAVHYGHFHHENHQFVQAYADILNNMNSALFTVSLVARKTYKCTPETNAYTRKLLQPIRWHPQHYETFSGALRWLETQMLKLKLIIRMTIGHTYTTQDIEYTDRVRMKCLQKESSVCWPEFPPFYLQSVPGSVLLRIRLHTPDGFSFSRIMLIRRAQ
ncbi:menaquinone-dependent protoporphyrinogen IX dehydrogenase [Klebsiella michiganensis]|uniref:menaquinone-dependent protoporphyrinogen IX dehydrogenase n=1 Tax=Klebsiella michiganensis TaxID=1134687 RepID=UPI003F50CD34